MPVSENSPSSRLQERELGRTLVSRVQTHLLLHSASLIHQNQWRFTKGLLCARASRPISQPFSFLATISRPVPAFRIHLSITMRAA